MSAILQGGLLTVLLLIATYTDIKKRMIPDTVCLFIALTVLLDFTPGKLFGIFVALPVLFMAYFFGGICGGDIKLIAAIGIVLGFAGGTTAVIISFLAELLFYLCYKAIQKLRHREHLKWLPLAPFLTVGTLTVHFMNTGGLTLWVF